MNLDFENIPIEYLAKIFDTVRVIDLKNNKVVIENVENINSSVDKTCYSILCKDSICKNCISSRAYYENKTVTKLEHSNDKVFLVIATPIIYGEEKYILETLKDISSSIIFNEQKLPRKEVLVDHIKRIDELVVKDELTDVYNRRYLNERLDIDIKSSIMNNFELSLVMIDVDYFKKINDRYHHIVGDYVLKEFVNVLLSNIRSDYDWIARYGGEEFAIVFRNTDIKEATLHSERIRKAIENHNFKYDNINISVTASFGVSSISEEINNSGLLLQKADEQLYIAKKKGRNRVENA
ncbi:GGDEF domain-containing protein [Clostridium saccharobutylicum]|uniref:Response regulator PleD n=1 Tax=Clostridium saccharobutylicum TaxID=169679 RepID=A0A1S8MTF1_CLOSA|nr:GGDEF domain-containing protein [Clostridium saccharobutylicum]OOM07455.1 response regulator PleD [Clostridium saccharobutylicum]